MKPICKSTNSKTWGSDQMRAIFGFLMVFLCLGQGARAEDNKLEYMDRGGYFEGYHGQPVSSGRDYRVVSFRAWTESIESELKGDLILGFHADNKLQAFPIVQLCDQESHYLLNRVEPKKIKECGESNHFEFRWSPDIVLKKTDEKPNLRELAAVVRLGNPEAQSVQRLAPVLLTTGTGPVQVQYYVLDFYMAETVTVTCTLQDSLGATIKCPDLERINKIEGDTYAFPIKFCADHLNDNMEYVLSIMGEYIPKNEKAISQVIFFKHRAKWAPQKQGEG